MDVWIEFWRVKIYPIEDLRDFLNWLNAELPLFFLVTFPSSLLPMEFVSSYVARLTKSACPSLGP